MWRRVISEHHGTVLLASVNDSDVGFISFGPSRDHDGMEKAEIYAIYVPPKFWHRGIGRDLLKEAEGRLEGQHFTAFTLWVLEKNVQGRQCYQAKGFRLDANRTPPSTWADRTFSQAYQNPFKPDQEAVLIFASVTRGYA